jgi:uncharacterized protein (DUF1330 family)
VQNDVIGFSFMLQLHYLKSGGGSMSAYVVLDIKVTDPQVYEEYKKLSPAALAAYGGKFLARGGKVETLEGEWAPQRLVILEFENAARAKQWLESPEYSRARKMRHQASSTQMIVVDGVSQP